MPLKSSKQIQRARFCFSLSISTSCKSFMHRGDTVSKSWDMNSNAGLVDLPEHSFSHTGAFPFFKSDFVSNWREGLQWCYFCNAHISPEVTSRGKKNRSTRSKELDPTTYKSAVITFSLKSGISYCLPPAAPPTPSPPPSPQPPPPSQAHLSAQPSAGQDADVSDHVSLDSNAQSGDDRSRIVHGERRARVAGQRIKTKTGRWGLNPLSVFFLALCGPSDSPAEMERMETNINKQ